MASVLIRSPVGQAELGLHDLVEVAGVELDELGAVARVGAYTPVNAAANAFG